MTVSTQPVLVNRLLPSSRVASIVAVVGFAVFTALMAQVVFRIPPIAVPFTGSTLAVLLTGSALGGRRGAASMMLYLAAGAVGIPVFAEQNSGFSTFVGATGGYLVGFVVAAFVIGKMAERRWDRRVTKGFVTFALGSLIIYAFGVTGLMVNLDLTFAAAVQNGVVPFLFWDTLKALIAALALPLAWKLTRST